MLGQAGELVAQPDRPGGWVHTDERLLQGTGRMSMAIAPVIAHAADRLEGLAARLSAPDAAFLDVGTGAGWLAIALARANPGLRVVGIDIFDPALELAHRNRTASGLDERLELRRQDVTMLDDEGAFDAVWLALPFLPRAIVPGAIAAAARALKPGGWLLPGLYGGPPDALGQLIADLRTVRSGGHVMGHRRAGRRAHQARPDGRARDRSGVERAGAAVRGAAAAGLTGSGPSGDCGSRGRTAAASTRRGAEGDSADAAADFGSRSPHTAWQRDAPRS